MPRINYDCTNADQEEDLELPLEEAIKRIKTSRNRRIWICVRVQAAVAADQTKIFPLYGTLKVSAPQAIDFIQKVYEGRFEKEALVHLRIHKNSIFIN